MVSGPTSPSRAIVYGVTVGASAFSLLRGQLRWFQDSGWTVVLVTTPDDAANAAVNREGVVLHPVAMSRSITPFADLRALWCWLRVLGEVKPQAVNVSTPKAGLLGGLAATIKRIPRRVYVVRGLRMEGSKGLLAVILWLTEWLTMKLATDVVFVSRSLAAEANARKLLRVEKSWLVGKGSSNGVDSSAVAQRVADVDKAALRQRMGFGEDAFVIGYIGRLARDKGLETLIDAFAGISAPHIRLLTIGATEDEFIEGRLRALGDRERHIPWTDDVWGYLSAIDVLCLPTLREGFPNVVLEAAAAGIPSITTRATGAVDSVIDGETGILFDVADARALAARIQELEADRSLGYRLGAAAQRRALEEFQPERVWRGIAEILDGCPTPLDATRLYKSTTKGAQE